MKYRTPELGPHPYDASAYTLADVLRVYLPVGDPHHPERKALTEGQRTKVRRKAGRVRAAMVGASMTVVHK